MKLLPLVAVFAAVWASAQTLPPLKIQDATFTGSSRVRYVYVEFSHPVSVPSAADVALTSASSAKITQVSVDPPRPTNLLVFIDAPLTPDGPPRICFPAMRYTVGKQTATSAALCKDVTVLSVEDVKKRRDAILTELNNATKKTDEKDIFASGFVTTAQGGSQGGVDIALNPDLGIPGMTTFLNLKKATQPGSDLKNFEGGVRHRSVFSFSRDLMEQAKETPPGAALDAIIRQSQHRFLTASIFDVAAKLEGAATRFDVANFVGDTSWSLRTISRAFAKKKGYLRAFLTPVGFEGGKNLNTTAGTADTAAQNTSAKDKVEYIARYRAGAGFTLFYEDWESVFPIRRADFEVNAVGRHLFLKESMYNSKTKAVDTTNSGMRGYAQVALKLYVGQTAKGRFGVRLAYDRGSLPPVFARVKSFQFGFLFESSEDSPK